MHEHSHIHAADKVVGASRSRLAVAFFLNVTFALVEIVGAVWTGSVAIMADAIHDFGDALSLGFAWLLAGMAERPGTTKLSYGYRRLTLLGAFITAIVLAAGSIGIIVEAVPRLIEPTQPNAQGMLGLAVLGIAVNGVAFLQLRAGKTLNERVVSWHLLEDVLGWLGVLIASVVMMFVDAPILDPLLSLAIAGFVLWNVVRKIRSTLHLFLEGTPEDVSTEDIAQQLAALPGVLGVHHLHVWSLDGERHLATAHLVVDRLSTAEAQLQIRRQAHAALRTLGIDHATLEIEVGTEACIDPQPMSTKGAKSVD